MQLLLFAFAIFCLVTRVRLVPGCLALRSPEHVNPRPAPAFVVQCCAQLL